MGRTNRVVALAVFFVRENVRAFRWDKKIAYNNEVTVLTRCHKAEFNCTYKQLFRERLSYKRGDQKLTRQCRK